MRHFRISVFTYLLLLQPTAYSQSIVNPNNRSNLSYNYDDYPGQGNACHNYLISKKLEEDGEAELCIVRFQNGPIKEFGVNGITNEALLAVLIDRLRGFQSGQFKCRENAIVLTNLEESLMWLQKRTRDRMFRGVEGTNTI